MPRNGQRIKRPKRGKLILGRDILPLVDFYNAFMQSKIVNGSSSEVLISDLAILFKIAAGNSSTPTSPSPTGSITQLRFKSYHSNYFTCRTWDGTTEGSTDVYVSVPFKLLEITGETIDGDSYTYAYSNDANGNRVRNIGKTGSPLFSENQLIVPRLLTNDLILAAPIPTGYNTLAGVAPTYVDLNVDGRAWCGTSGFSTVFTDL